MAFVLTRPTSSGGTAGGTLPDGMTVTIINGQPILTLEDTTRGNKILSISETEFGWSENLLNDNDWVSVGDASDARTCHVMPMNGAIVRIAAHTSEDNNIAKDINLYIDGTFNGVIGSFQGIGGESSIINTALNIDLIQGSKLRLRAGGNGSIEDTTISIFVKWRA